MAEEGRNSGQLWTKKDNREEAAGLAEVNKAFVTAST